MNIVEKILSEYPFIILDGGFATELEKKGFNLKDRLWSAKLIADAPDAVRDVHLSYLNAGADCIITSSYQATVPGFISAGYTRKDAVKFLGDSVRIANDALRLFHESAPDMSNRPIPFIAASAGCYGAFLSDGSEYRGDYHLDPAGYKNFHRERLDILIDAGADIIAFETFPSLEEASAVAELMDEYSGVQYWIVFTVKDASTTSHGDNFRDCIKFLQGRKNLIAAGINCSPPEFITPVLDSLEIKLKKNFAVYPNSGEHYHTDCSCWEDDPSASDYRRLAEEWYRKGAVLIGGCCRTGPADIAKIKSFRDELMQRNSNSF
ncbi:MAG TPA: homocysteine S-methyltransferase [Spirochaetota bacterium]|nr:homocysteine S-methyltransferase [Spirochaetota bacterium]HPS87371.1 homocysteine S-methyltransferase [Spirochaetota bacterium]